MELYDILFELEDSKTATLITMIKEDIDSTQLLIVDGKVVYTSNDAIKDLDINKLGTLELGIKYIDDKKYFIEPLGRECKLTVCGGGYVAQAVVKMAKLLGFKITALEDRLNFVNELKRAGADEVLYDEFENSIEKIRGDNNTFFVILTRGHKYDLVCLRSILNKNYAYLGMISSKYRAANAKKTMLDEGFSKEKLETIHSPVGIRIGAQTPEEIAVSILAEIILEKNTKNKKSGFSEEMIEVIRNIDKHMVIATIIGRKGSSPRDIGTKMLITEDQMTVGTLGGGCAEAEVVSRAKEVLITGKNRIYKLDMTGKTAIEDEGMICGGIIDVLVERVK